MAVDFLQYGALGLVGLVLVGVSWYVKQVEARQAAHDEYERQERRQYLDAQMGLIKALTLLAERMESHEERACARHRELMEQFGNE